MSGDGAPSSQSGSAAREAPHPTATVARTSKRCTQALTHHAHTQLALHTKAGCEVGHMTFSQSSKLQHL